MRLTKQTKIDKQKRKLLTNIECREEEKKIILAASEFLGLATASFIRSSALEKARKVISQINGVEKRV
jgi:uncharacterized protein (DUF1778 family)